MRGADRDHLLACTKMLAHTQSETLNQALQATFLPPPYMHCTESAGGGGGSPVTNCFALSLDDWRLESQPSGIRCS